MKKLLAVGLLLVCGLALAQTFPVGNLVVTGSASFAQSPTAPTPTAGDSSTKLATTAFVHGSPFAPIGSPAFTGVPTAPTAPIGTNTTQLATTAFVASHAPCPSILDYGGDNTGVANNDAAWTATLAALPVGQKCVFFPAGKFKFGGPVSYTMANTSESLTIMGAGAGQTELTWGATNGITISFRGSFNTIHVRDLTLSTSGVGTGTALTLTQTAASLPNPALTALSDITNVTIRGADGYVQTDYWTTGIVDFAVSNINFVGLNVWGPTAGPSFTSVGVGVSISGTSALFPVVFNFSGCYFGWVGIGINYGAYVQGLTVSQSNFVGGDYGVNVPPGLVATGLDQLVVNSSNFNVGNAGIYTQTYVANTQLFGNLFIIAANSQGINLAQSCLYSITGNNFNLFSGTSTNGVVINNSSCGGIISGNNFNDMTTAIFLQSGSSFANIQSNFYVGNTANVVNSGTNNTVGGGSQ